ncbi:unnamed protein product [Malus baccata var. baccata]
MARTRPGKNESKDTDSYTIRGTNKIVRPPYVARIEKIEGESRGGMKVRIGGRRQFHGAKELFLSDHYDVQSAHAIEGKCTMHFFKNYTKLENVGAEDYYCRFEYKACKMPYNSDDLMVQCEGTRDNCGGLVDHAERKRESKIKSFCSHLLEPKDSLD